MNRPVKTLVIGTSLSSASDALVKDGVALARRTGATPWLIHAYLPVALPAGVGLDAQWIDEQVKTLHELLVEQARRTGLSALPGYSPEQLRLVVGSAHREIVDLARRVRADLVVVGAAETEHVILGSTADRVIRKAPCPVLAVRAGAKFPPARVEISVDLSPISANAFRQGLDFLVQLGVQPAETEALFVLNPFEVGGSINFTQEQIERFAGEELDRFLAANSPAGARPAAVRVLTGYPREEILRRLAERQADLAVLGTHGRSGFERLVIGSVAAGVLRAASCNVLVVPPAAAGLPDTAAEDREERAGADWSYVSDEAPVPAG